MKAIQIVVDEATLRNADKEARRAGVNRSALIRTALKHYLRRLQELKLEQQHHRGYQKHPVQPGEFDVWDKVRGWPED